MSNAAVQLQTNPPTASLQEMAQTLESTLTRMLTAYIVGIRNVKTISRWAAGEVKSVRDLAVEQRLIAAYQIVSLLKEYENDMVIRRFFLGMNASLNDNSPADELRAGNYRDVMGAAKLHITGDYA